MSKFKAAVLDTSLFRRSYIICLLMCNVTLLLIPAYAMLAVMFLWGAFLVIHNEIKRRLADTVSGVVGVHADLSYQQSGADESL